MRRPINIWLFMAAITSFAVAPAAAQFSLVSEKQELEAGQQADQQLTQKYRLSSDSYWNSTVSNSAVGWLKSASGPTFPGRFVFNSNELNAFSVPGYVSVPQTTLETVRGDQDAIAGVLAHEIGHTCGKHARNQMEKGTIGGAARWDSRWKEQVGIRPCECRCEPDHAGI